MSISSPSSARSCPYSCSKMSLYSSSSSSASNSTTSHCSSNVTVFLLCLRPPPPSPPESRGPCKRLDTSEERPGDGEPCLSRWFLALVFRIWISFGGGGGSGGSIPVPLPLL